MTSVLIVGGNLDTDTHTGRTPGDNIGRGWGNASQCKEHQKLLANHQKVEGKAWNSFSLVALRKKKPH